jgi:hypothetical protein
MTLSSGYLIKTIIFPSTCNSEYLVEEQVLKFRREKNREPSEEEVEGMRANIEAMIEASRATEGDGDDGEGEGDEGEVEAGEGKDEDGDDDEGEGNGDSDADNDDEGAEHYA